MTTTPEDPFAAPPTAPAASPADTPATPQTPASTPPGVLVPGPPAATPPGVLASGPAAYVPAAPPAYPVYGPAPVAPRGLATATIALTGAYTLAGLLTAAFMGSIVDNLKVSLADPDNASLDLTATALQGLSGLASIASFVFLALWISRIRQNLTAIGSKPGGPPAVEWWGWFVPVANFVLPALGMRAVSKRSVGIGVLLGWWLPFCASFVLSIGASMRQFLAVDWVTRKLTNPGALDAMVPLTAVSAVLVLISWVFLVVIIRRTTSRHLTA